MQTALNTFSNPLAPADGKAPEFIHLLPAGTFTGVDGRGPYTVEDVAALLAASSARKIPIDVNHAIDIHTKAGNAAPAVGWIVALEARADGVWGKSEWTAEGERLVGGRAYGFISPVFMHTKEAPHRVTQLLRASLTNDPNLADLTALHHRQEISEMEKELREALGLPETADAAAIIAAAKTAHASSAAAVALNARLVTVAGLTANASADELVTALQARGTDSGKEVTELRAEVKALNARLTETVTENAKSKAEHFVQKAMDEGRLVPALRERFIARHIKDPAEVEAEVALMPSLHAHSLRDYQPSETGAADPAEISTQARKYQDEQAALGRRISISEAVAHVSTKK